MKRVLSLIFLFFPGMLISQHPDFPETYKDSLTDTIFNELVSDEYSWLEKVYSPQCKEWVKQQNAYTKKALRKASNKWDSYVAIDKYAYVKYDNPIKMGDYFFTYAYHNNYNVPAIFVQNSLNSDPEILVDPAYISGKDNILIKDFDVSKNSEYLAYQFSRNGSDWCEIKVVNIKSGHHKKDHLKNVKYSNIAWRGNGFYYSSFSGQEIGVSMAQEIYYHQLGTEQKEDQLIFKRGNNPKAFFYAFTTSDERYLIVKEIDNEKNILNFFYIDFQSQILTLRPLLTRLSTNDNIEIIDNQGDYMIAVSYKDADNGMIIKFKPSEATMWNVVIPEYDSAFLRRVKLLDDKILTVYQTNRKQQIIFFDYQGNILHSLQLPFGFAAKGFSGEKEDTRILFSYEGYVIPKVVYILNTETYEMKSLRATVVNFDFTQFETKEFQCKSFDGTPIPLFMIYKKGMDLRANNPTLLETYGGFGVVEDPDFDPGIVHFLFQGGVYVYANIRGGSDRGIKWAKQGRGFNKPNSFKDFIAAAEFLISNNFTSPEKLAITGTSNGGLVVGVALTQKPELFGAAVPVVAPLDMVHYEKLILEHLYTSEYDSINDSIGFSNIYKYSPLVNVKDDVNYPPTLIMTSEFDDRVPPFHSFKFAAKLQNRAAQENPILLRVEKGAGHYGAGSSLKKRIKEKADMYDFILSNLER